MQDTYNTELFLPDRNTYKSMSYQVMPSIPAHMCTHFKKKKKGGIRKQRKMRSLPFIMVSMACLVK